MSCIGIRFEDKYIMEKRVPLTPKHIKRIISQFAIDVHVQSSAKRAFSDNEFTAAGASIKESLTDCKTIFGIKEIPVNMIEPDKTYIIFSHVIKGQKQNMPLLKKMMELNCNLIDYERIGDEMGRRLIFFGKYAGLAGAINTLWAYGLRLKTLGVENPFLELKQAHNYRSLEEAKKAISDVGHYIADKGLPENLCPLVIGITGYGNVSSGVQEMLGLLPIMEVDADEITHFNKKNYLNNKLIYKVIFKEENLCETIDGSEFDLIDYYNNPSRYKSKFEKYIPFLDIVLNCMYWDERYPRIITKNYLSKLFKNSAPKLKIIGDISCDVEGSVECTIKASEIEHPNYVYNPFTQKIKNGYEGDGVVVMAVDILPSELPRDSSYGFGDLLYNFVDPIAKANLNVSYEDIKLPYALKRGLIVHKGKLTPNYMYLEKFVNNLD